MLRRVILCVLVAPLLGWTPLAQAAESGGGSIDHVETTHGKLRVLYSLPGDGRTTPDLSTVRATFDGKPVDASAVLASKASDRVRRTAVLAVDVSSSMKKDGKFVAAQRAAQRFLDSAPADLRVGIVTFASKVAVAQQPTLDRAASAAVLKDLTLSRNTRLYDGLREAVTAAGTTGQRNVIVLSDGRDTSTTPESSAVRAVRRAGVKVDVVALDQSQREERLLAPLSRAGGGSVISARDPQALSSAFTSEARGLANQVQVTGTVPDGVREGTLAVSVESGGRRYSDSAYVTVTGSSNPADATPATASAAHLAAPSAGPAVTHQMMLGGLAALAVGALVVVFTLIGGVGRRDDSIETRIAVYTQKGAPAAARPGQNPQGMATSAVNLATRALGNNQGFEEKLGKKLEAAAVSFKPAEWLLLHAGVAMGGALLAFLVTGGSLVMAIIGFLVAALMAWAYLGRRQAKRLKAFNSQLAGTLQLMAGSLQAGLSFAQGIDTIVREGAEPMAGEFRRALVETRLGVSIEDALDSLAARMASDDFRWTVMAIRIQREVGGNLAQLMLTVAATLREREYLRRQVKSLSAEGRFSAYILLGLPPLVLLYEAMTNREYLTPLLTTGMGYMLLGVMTLLMGVGGYMMKRMIKLEV